MKFNLSVMIEPDLHKIARSYADAKNISFSRLVHEVLCQFLGHEGKLNPEFKASLEERIVRAPGRKRLTIEEIQERQHEKEKLRAEKRAAKARAELERLKIKYPGAMPAPRQPDSEDEDP